MAHIHSWFAAALVIGGLVSAAPARAQQSVKSDLPDSLVKQAKVDEATTRSTAERRVPNGQIRAVELERERGHFQCSYDVTVPGKSGTTEVNIDAVTGKVIDVHHESARDEAKEAASEHKSGT